MIDHPALSGLERLAALPKLRHGVPRVFYRKNDDVDVIHLQRRNRFHMDTAVDAWLARPDVSCHSKVFVVPFPGGDRVFTQQVYVSEAMMSRGVQLDQSVVRSIDIGVEEASGRLANQVADIGNWRLEPGP